MSEYSKALVAFGLGLALVVAGLILGDETLRSIGYGSLAASPLVYVVENGPADNERGYALVELLVGAILLLVFVWLVFALVD